MTPLQDARERLSDFENTVKAELAVKAKADAEIALAGKARARALARAQKVQVLIERPGRVVIGSIASIKAAYVGQSEHEALVKQGRKMPAVATEMVTSGAIKVSVVSEGTALSLAGLARKTHVVDAAALRRIDVMRRKKIKADAAAYKANAELIAATRREFDAAPKIDPVLISEYVGEYVALAVRDNTARRSIKWEFASPDRIGETRKTLTTHLDHVKSKSKEPCPCWPCAKQRRDVEWAKEHAA